jgi:eukaryotic-like serine/threonine-protein kinase
VLRITRLAAGRLAAAAKRLAAPADPRHRDHLLSMNDTTCEPASPLGDAPAMLESLAERRRRDDIRARLFATDEVPPLIGRYEVIRRLGAGAIGVVYLCRDPRLRRAIAVKVLREPTADAARLRREAQAMARLSDPHVAAIYEVGTHEGRVHVAMELVDGVTLRTWQAGRTVDEVLAAYLQAGKGLAAAHRVGIVHRDFKPDNAMRGHDGRVRVLDFGLACAAGDEEQIATSTGVDASPLDATATGTTLGTPAYMPPEQLRSADVDARADQFAFCVALWEALHGARPFGGASTSALASAIRSAELPPPVAHVPPRVRAVLTRGLAADPDRRFADMPELLHALAGATPPRKRGIMLALGTIAVGLALVVQSQSPDDCTRAEAGLDGIWTTPIAHATRRELLAADVPDDRWAPRMGDIEERARAWRSEARAVCYDSGASDIRRACLTDVRDAIAAEVAVLRSGLAPSSSRTLTLASCASLRERGAVPVTAAAEHLAAVDEIRVSISSVVDAGSAGEYATARAEIAPTVARAREIDEPVLLAETLLLSAAVAQQEGDYAVAERDETEAYEVALSAGHDRLALRAAGALVETTGYTLRRREDGERWARTGEALLPHVAPDDPMIARFLVNRGLMRIEHDELDEARTDLERARDIHIAADGPEAIEQRPILGNLAHIAMLRGDLAEAHDLMNREIALVEHHLGPEHPELVSELSNRAVIATARDLYDEALADLERALAIAEVSPRRHVIPFVHNNLAEVRYEQGRFTDALVESERGVADLASVVGEDHPKLVSARVRLAAILARSGDPARARTILQTTIARAEGRLGPDHRDLVDARVEIAGLELRAGAVAAAERELDRVMPLPTGLGARCTVVLARARQAEVLRTRGHAAAAEAPLRAAVARSVGCPGTTVAEAELALAHVLAAIGGDETELRALAHAARDRWRARGNGWEPRAQAVDHWLEERGR